MELELKLELIHSQMTQKPVMRGEVAKWKWARVRGAYVVRRKRSCGRARVVQGAWVSGRKF